MEVEPIYMPGRFRTASRPSSTWISDASYSLAASTVVEFRISFSAMQVLLSGKCLVSHKAGRTGSEPSPARFSLPWISLDL